MIQWLHDLGKDWGRWMRRNPNGWPHKSLLGTIMEYGSVGAAIRTHQQIIPVPDMPEDVRDFHNAWVAADSRAKFTIYVFYYTVGNVDEKADALGISRRTLYDRVSRAQAELWSIIDLQKRVQKVRELPV